MVKNINKNVTKMNLVEDHFEKKKDFFDFNNLDKKFFIEVLGNIIKIIIGSLTFISGLAWNNYFLKFQFAQNSVIYPIATTIITSIVIILLNYLNLN